MISRLARTLICLTLLRVMPTDEFKTNSLILEDLGLCCHARELGGHKHYRSLISFSRHEGRPRGATLVQRNPSGLNGLFLEFRQMNAPRNPLQSSWEYFLPNRTHPGTRSSPAWAGGSRQPAPVPVGHGGHS